MKILILLQLDSVKKEMKVSNRQIELANIEVTKLKNELGAVSGKNEKLKKEFLMIEEGFKDNDGKVLFQGYNMGYSSEVAQVCESLS